MATAWKKSAAAARKPYPEQAGSIDADVAIIGGGIAGILNAYLLTKSGMNVVLLEQRSLGSGATLATTAFITQVIDTSITEIADLFGRQAAGMVWQSGGEAIREIEKIITEEKISCEFTKCANYVFAGTKKQREILEKDRRTYAKIGADAELREDGSGLEFRNFGYLKIPNQAKFDPAKFIFGVAEAAVADGALFFENSKAMNISTAEDGRLKVKTKKGEVTARDVIIATYKPMVNKKMHFKKGMYRSYLLELEIPKGILEEAIYEDESNPYHYFRVDRCGAHDRMIVGGEDHKDIFGNMLVRESFGALRDFVARTFPGLHSRTLSRWHGPILEPSDGLPLIGRIAPHCFVATAFSGNGMTYSMVSALMNRDLMLGHENRWADVYDPTRLMRPKRLAVKASDYIEEFFGGAVRNLVK